MLCRNTYKLEIFTKNWFPKGIVFSGSLLNYISILFSKWLILVFFLFLTFKIWWIQFFIEGVGVLIQVYTFLLKIPFTCCSLKAMGHWVYKASTYACLYFFYIHNALLMCKNVLKLAYISLFYRWNFDYTILFRIKFINGSVDNKKRDLELQQAIYSITFRFFHYSTCVIIFFGDILFDCLCME